MRAFNRIVLSTAFCAVSCCAAARGEEPTISIKEVLARAASGPEVAAAEARARSSADEASALRRGTYAPKVGGALAYSHLFQDQSIVLPPMGGMPLPPIAAQSDMKVAAAQLTLPLFDPANMLFNTRSARRRAEAEGLRSSRQVKETQGKAVECYLKVLELRSRRRALEVFRDNLKARRNEITRLYELGAVGESDVLKIKLGVEDAEQGIREISLKEEDLARMLAVVLGSDRVDVPGDLPEDLPPEEAADELPDVGRHEAIRAIDADLDSLKSAQRGLEADYLPKVSAFAQHAYVDADLLSRSSFDAGGVLLTWSLFDGGVSLAKAKAAEEQQESLRRMRGVAAGSIRAGFRDAIGALRTKRREYGERRAAVVEAQDVERIEFNRLKNGKSTVNDLIDAEDILKDRVEKASLSRVSWYQAWFKMQLAAGTPLSAP